MTQQRSRPRRRLQICASNQLASRPDLLGRLQNKGCTIEIEECLDECTRCSNCAFALVAGQFVFAATPEEFMRKLRL